MMLNTIETKWVVVNSDGFLHPDFICYLRRDAIKAMEMELSERWHFLKRKGFRCLKVEVTVKEVADNTK